jgi:NAD-dependent dihydropyrimidine dehydrogenase PreA subunit
MIIKRKIVEIDEALCSGCGECATACAEGAIQIVDGKARLISENYCDGLGACLGECPEGALTILERESEEFDPDAVEEHLKAGSEAAGNGHQDIPMACGCPSQNIEVFPSSVREGARSETRGPEDATSALTHWPVQIRLVPPTAPFLKNADLLIAADCTPLAYAGFHRDLLPGRVVMMGCPKFDNIDEYVEKFTEVFKSAGIRSITVVDMEVPCCSKLPMIVRKALSLSQKRIPIEEVVIGRRGDILQKRAVA